MNGEQTENKNHLTPRLSVYTNNTTMRTGRPPKAEHLKRTKWFPVRLTPNEMVELKKASRSLGESVASILRKGARLYMHRKGKDGSRTKGEKK